MELYFRFFSQFRNGEKLWHCKIVQNQLSSLNWYILNAPICVVAVAFLHSVKSVLFL